MGRSSGSLILEELLMFTPNSGSSSSSTGKGFLQLKESEGPFFISNSLTNIYHCSAFYLLVYLNVFHLCDPNESKLIFPYLFKVFKCKYYLIFKDNIT